MRLRRCLPILVLFVPSLVFPGLRVRMLPFCTTHGRRHQRGNLLRQLFNFRIERLPLFAIPAAQALGNRLQYRRMQLPEALRRGGPFQQGELRGGRRGSEKQSAAPRGAAPQPRRASDRRAEAGPPRAWHDR